MRLIVGWDAAIARWVGERLDIEDFGSYRAIGVCDEDGDIVAGVVYNNKRERNIEATIASIVPKWATRIVLRAIFAYPFCQLDCTRLTAVVESTNQPVRAFLCRLGFREEGTMRRAFRTGNDAVIYGMLREECRWLEENRHVQRRL